MLKKHFISGMNSQFFHFLKIFLIMKKFLDIVYLLAHFITQLACFALGIFTITVLLEVFESMINQNISFWDQSLQLSREKITMGAIGFFGLMSPNIFDRP